MMNDYKVLVVLAKTHRFLTTPWLTLRCAMVYRLSLWYEVQSFKSTLGFHWRIKSIIQPALEPPCPQPTQLNKIFWPSATATSSAILESGAITATPKSEFGTTAAVADWEA